ncbi:unnamed protein product [Adineta ricciae]|uniref:Glycosyl transferase family 25 domain-containing protein n=1 Tax=Adineta ricciae TaxID=249248 RepID=A0A815WAL1_ADIRI|nr:unnamed protein product [Adineta ricciae]
MYIKISNLLEIKSDSGPRSQWKTFSFPGEFLPINVTPWTPSIVRRKENKSVVMTSPLSTTTGLEFVDHIYIVTHPRLTDRHENLKRILNKHKITDYEWRMRWTYAACRNASNPTAQRRCAISMEHVDIWHDIVARNSSLSLILEDDAIFVPYFREKFHRTIFTAIRTGILKIGKQIQCMNNRLFSSINDHEWFEQDPMIVIGSCFNTHDPNFSIYQSDASPMFSTHKQKSARCSHAYLLTACSAKALLNQIKNQKNRLLGSDFMLDIYIAASPTIQSFWLDPPLVYQGNQIIDLDRIPSFKTTTY